MFRNLYLDYIRIGSRLCFLYLLLKIVLETLQYSLLQRYGEYMNSSNHLN